MGWFLVNIMVPVGLPLVLLFIAKSVDLPDPYASRTRLIKAVQDGQLGWVATVFAAACAYELDELKRTKGAPEWADLVFLISLFFLIISGFLSMLGTLFPVDESKHREAGVLGWVRHYRMFVGTSLATVITAALLTLVHNSLPVPLPCKEQGTAVPSKKEANND